MRAAACRLSALDRLAAAIIGLLSLGGCATRERDALPADAAVLHDLVDETPLADAESETLRIDLGTSQARERLIRGWSRDERSPEGTPFVWSSGRASLLEFFLSEPRDLTLELHCFPFVDESRPPMIVRLNGRQAGAFALEPGPRTYRLPAPAWMLTRGMNRLEFLYAFSEVPARRRGGSNDPRELAVGWNWIGFWPPGSETGRIDLGTALAHPFEVAGWSSDEKVPERKATLAWGVGKESRLRFLVRNLRDLPVSFRCATAPFGGANREGVQVRANDRPVGVLNVDGQLREHRLVLPRTALHLGTNEITLAYARALTTGTGFSPDSRASAIAWETLRFLDVDGTAPTPPSADAQSRTLRIPAGTSLDFYVKLDGAARVTLDDVRLYGDPGCRLRLGLEPDPGPARVLAELREATSHASFPISAPAGGLARLSFASVCSGRQGGAFVQQPALRRMAAPAGRLPPTPTVSPPTRTPQRKLPLVIVYLVDSLRADHLGCYGYPKPVSPHIDAFARDALLFTQARSHTSWTRPAVASLFTGLEPSAHGVLGEHDALSSDAVTLARILKAAGYRTGAVITNGNIGRPFGFANGFDFFRERYQKADQVNRAAVHWLDEGARERPVFLYLHTIEPHEPYDPPAAYRRRFAADARTPGAGSERQLDELLASGKPLAARVRHDLVELYDAEIAASDAAFGELMEMLRARGRYDDALIVFCADHGEELGDHGAWRHGHALYQELVHIPLIVKRTGAVPNSGRRVAGLFQPADIFLMILGELGLETEGGWEGRSLLNAAGGRSPVQDHGAVFFSLELGVRRTIAVQDGEWKLIRESGTEARTELFNLHEDPAETRDLFDSRPVRAKYLLGLLRARGQAVARPSSAREVIPDAALRERLRGLGYTE